MQEDGRSRSRKVRELVICEDKREDGEWTGFGFQFGNGGYLKTRWGG